MKGTEGSNVIAVEQVPWDEVCRYGVLGFADSMRINAMIEKPTRDLAPSNCIISGRYILQPGIFHKIAAIKPGAGGEIQLTDAMIA